MELFPELCFVCVVDNYNWPKTLREIFEDSLAAYRAGKHDARSMFDEKQSDFLEAIGATPQEIFDFVEDTSYGGEPGFETTLLITATRREYFAEFNTAHPTRKLSPIYGLKYFLPVPYCHQPWSELFYLAHFFDHPCYNQHDGLSKPRVGGTRNRTHSRCGFSARSLGCRQRPQSRSGIRAQGRR